MLPAVTTPSSAVAPPSNPSIGAAGWKRSRQAAEAPILYGQMGRGPLIATTLLAAGALIAGCGGGTKTVTVSSAPPHRTTTTHTTRSHSPTKSSASSSTTSTSTTQSTTQTSTRTSSAPAFVGKKEESEAGSEALNAAVAVVKQHGYTPKGTSEYHGEQTLRVLIGVKAGSEGHEQQAFFFLGGTYIGTDASKPSGYVQVTSQGDTEVTLAYGLYKTGGELCCPSGTASVRFQLNNGKLVAVDPIPPAHSETGLARR